MSVIAQSELDIRICSSFFPLGVPRIYLTANTFYIFVWLNVAIGI